MDDEITMRQERTRKNQQKRMEGKTDGRIGGRNQVKIHQTCAKLVPEGRYIVVWNFV
jgi:hypothetical protein